MAMAAAPLTASTGTRVIVKGPVIDQHGDHLTVAFHWHHRPVTVSRQHDRPVVDVDKRRPPGTG